MMPAPGAPGIELPAQLRETTDASAREAVARLLAASPCGLVVTDPTCPDNPIVWVNAVFKAVTGYTDADLLGQNCRLLQRRGGLARRKGQRHVLVDKAAVARMASATSTEAPAEFSGTVLNFTKVRRDMGGATQKEGVGRAAPRRERQKVTWAGSPATWWLLSFRRPRRR